MSMFSWTLHGDGRTIAPGGAVAPDERLTYPRTIGIGMQHVLAMMGATLLVPALTGMPAATTMFFSAIGTALFLTITRNRVPSYLGSSFAFLAPLGAAGVTSANAPLDAATISRGLGGVLLAGVLLVVVGVVVNLAGAAWIARLMPPVVTGAIVALIGLNLAGAARNQWEASPWTALVTLVAVLVSMVAFRGFLGRIAILVGAVVGGVFSALRGEWTTPLDSLGGVSPTDYIGQASWFGLPTFHTPTFDGSVLVAFVPVVLILMAENIGHLKSVTAMTGRNLDSQTGKALLADGLATTIAGLGGGSGTTTYAENIGVMAATRVYSTLAYWAAAGFALILSLVPKFGAMVAVIPQGILGGLSVLLFGLIAVLGARIWVENGVDFTRPVNLVTAAVALIVGTADFTATAGSMVFNGIALGAIAALAIFHGLGWIARRRGADVPEPHGTPTDADI
ncbi:solute carrier family 23 protein [Demequina capsici]|uniref:Solute carrier family 23 protein n=1 Tax=Demequina capsici TaxID=3075620 RepID=A0AA96FDP6_9MICO|nr:MULTISPECIES: solute carrier family 23 protein [unclassified Demequina]WNM24787.1 solute carrier family 23 protein [Demequina sp. OYTSA14]WNM27694.1 solute carrier family 23 protein [Demequina sp. PMTSA13]